MSNIGNPLRRHEILPLRCPPQETPAERTRPAPSKPREPAEPDKVS